jgi:peptidoglycan biosynthesis protein MviN/MurJ (putative lipid II flippase)
VALFYKLFGTAVEILFSPAFAAFVLLKRSSPGPFPSWAKGLAIGAAVAGLVAAGLHFALPRCRELGLRDDDYVELMHFWRTLVGVVMGIIISIVVACMRTRRRESGDGSV